MEQQLTIFDVFREMDETEGKEISLYERCSVPGIRFQELTGAIAKRHKGMNFKCVTHGKTRKKLFLISIEEVEREENKISFHYQALDGYWGGNYGTDDVELIKRSILNVSRQILNDGEAI